MDENGEDDRDDSDTEGEEQTSQCALFPSYLTVVTKAAPAMHFAKTEFADIN